MSLLQYKTKKAGNTGFFLTSYVILIYVQGGCNLVVVFKVDAGMGGLHSCKTAAGNNYNFKIKSAILYEIRLNIHKPNSKISHCQGMVGVAVG